MDAHASSRHPRHDPGAGDFFAARGFTFGSALQRADDYDLQIHDVGVGEAGLQQVARRVEERIRVVPP